MVAKCTGTAEYSIDVRLPDMLYATVRMNPQLGGAMLSFDAADASTMPGVRQIVPLDGGLIVIASNTWYAMQAAKAVQCEWGNAPYPAATAEHFAMLAQSFDDDHDSRMLDEGDVEEALADGSDVEAEYRVPYLAHATMEPLNAVAWLRDGQLDVWAGTQAPTQAVKDSAAIAGIDESNVRLHTTLMGGGFGRRAEADFIKTAVHAASAMPGVPIKMTWSREEDMTHDAYRPLAMARFRARVADNGPLAFDLALAAPSAIESQLSRIGMSIPGPDVSIVQAAWDQPYAIPNYRVTGYRPPVMAPLSSWRSVGASQNGFFHESAIDEIAHAAGTDPLAMRLRLITHEPSRKVLEAVATLSDWESELPAGHGRGVAFVLSFGVPVAEVVEVADTANGIRIVHVWAAVDVGTALDPRNIEAQVQSAVIFGLSAATTGEITIKDGRVEQSNFHNYDAMRMPQTPTIDVKILENGSKIRGIGEPGLPPAAPALANAIFAATGQRIRELPMNKHIRFA
jgi:isoquinoline 1-oxidoreductase beta subunit